MLRATAFTIITAAAPALSYASIPAGEHHALPECIIAHLNSGRLQAIIAGFSKSRSQCHALFRLPRTTARRPRALRTPTFLAVRALIPTFQRLTTSVATQEYLLR